MANFRPPPRKRTRRPRLLQTPTRAPALLPRLLPWFMGAVLTVFLISLVPNFWPGLRPAPPGVPNTALDVAPIPLWSSSFEDPFPDKAWSPPRFVNFSPTGKPLPDASSQWTVFAPDPKVLNITPPQGSHLYKGWINRPNADGTPHRSYPLLSLDNNAAYLQNLDKPLVTRFSVWVDWDGPTVQNNDWITLMELGQKGGLQPISLAMRGPSNALELFNVGPLGGFKKGGGWEIIAPTEILSLPLRQWVTFTVYIDYQEPLLIVWMDDVPILRANGGNLRSTDGRVPYAAILHWGLQAAGSLKNATVYNDHLQLWALPAPLVNFQQQPRSPYEKTQREKWMELPPDAPPAVNTPPANTEPVPQ